MGAGPVIDQDTACSAGIYRRHAAASLVADTEPFGIGQTSIYKLVAVRRVYFGFQYVQKLFHFLLILRITVPGDPVFNLFHFLLLFIAVKTELRKVALGILVPGIVEEGHEFIILFEMEGIVRMAVALDAGEGGALPNLPGRMLPVDYRGGLVFFVIGATFVFIHGIPVK